MKTKAKATRYIGFNDLTTGNQITFPEVDENQYGKGLNEVIHDALRAHGDFEALLEPVEGDPQFEGYQRIVITVGPPEFDPEQDQCDQCDRDQCDWNRCPLCNAEFRDCEAPRNGLCVEGCECEPERLSP